LRGEKKKVYQCPHPFPTCTFQVTPAKLEAEQLYDSQHKFCITAATHPAEGAHVLHFTPKSPKYFEKQMMYIYAQTSSPKTQMFRIELYISA